MSINKDTYIHSIITAAGGYNLFSESSAYYPKIPEAALGRINPDITLLPSEPFPFQDKHIEEIKLIWPNSRIHLINGEDLCWFGFRMPAGIRMLQNLFK